MKIFLPFHDFLLKNLPIFKRDFHYINSRRETADVNVFKISEYFLLFVVHFIFFLDFQKNRIIIKTSIFPNDFF